ncbi:LVIVD repeat-containing protein [Pseudonocardia saturnea]
MRTATTGTRRRVRALVVVAAAAALALAAPTPGIASPASAAPPAPAPGPAVDEIVSSATMRQVANLPKQDPFTGPTSFGTDLAFQGDLAYVGNYDGFVVYDVKNPKRPQVVSQVLCPGSQNDVSVSGDLLFLSTDSQWADDSCSGTPATDPADYWEGIKVFDVSDPAAPRYVAAVETDCGSHTHTLVPDDAGGSLFLYVSSYDVNPILPGCAGPHDQISIIEVPIADPAAAAVVAEPVLFPDGGNPGPGSDTTTGCHDITVYPSKDLAAGACMGDGILMDISDRTAPRVIERVRDDTNFAFWHSATFNNAGTKVVFTDELGGGGAATCTEAVGPERGANGIYDIAGEGDDRTLEFAAYYKIPRLQTVNENCVAHNGSLIPVAGRDIMVQAWYQGGVSVWDFTDSTAPVELGFWERGPLSDTGLVLGGAWSAYWYDGHIFSSDIRKGLDVLQINDPAVNKARGVRFDVFNAQTQPSYR